MYIENGIMSKIKFMINDATDNVIIAKIKITENQRSNNNWGKNI